MSPILASVRARLAALIFFVILAGLAGCGGSGDGGSVSSGANGTLNIAMVDGPDPTISAFVVSIDRIEANINGTWTPINLSVQTFDLLNLAHSSLLVGSIGLPAGRYTQLRLFPSSATVTDANGTHDVTIPSADKTGIKINIDATVSPHQVTTVTLDFNIHKSLHQLGNGNYQMHPVISGFLQVANGSISGTMRDNGLPAAGATVTATYTSGSNYIAGTVVNSATTLANGTFTIWALLPGTYTLNVTYVDASNITKTATVTGVVVTANNDTAVGAIPVVP